MITFAEITSSKTLRRIKNYLLLDLETTGPDPELDSIIELGMVRVTDGEIVNRAKTLVNPETAIPPEATALTGITDAVCELFFDKHMDVFSIGIKCELA